MRHLTLMRSRWALLIVSVMLAGLLAGCGTQNGGSTGNSTAANVGEPVKTTDGTYTNLTPAELKPMLDHKDFFLVDVHTPPEGRLPNTDARIPFDQVANRISELPADKGAKIVLSCRSGSMSSEASATLVKLGYTNIYNLKGGMNAWKDAGYEIVPEAK
ncbi:MAG: rhodanese-like domain-containing protein [Chloroflexota bacterium]